MPKKYFAWRYEGRVGNLGFVEKPASTFDPSSRHLVPYVKHFRIPENEVRQVYEGFEVASHTRTHVNLTRCTEKERIAEIGEDITALSGLFGYQVVGFAYPYGAGAKQSRLALQSSGVRYARAIGSDTSFRFPVDPLKLPMSCWHVSRKAFQTLESFFAAEPGEDDLFFLMFAHGYEFDFGARESNWDKFKRICDVVVSHDDIVCCSIADAFARHEAEG